ncbi:MAG: hypothetical protein K2X87_13380 [Gemmataceae bacterium]|nr:hypothetical protein [Gemmataceae bacterium]
MTFHQAVAQSQTMADLGAAFRQGLTDLYTQGLNQPRPTERAGDVGVDPEPDLPEAVEAPTDAEMEAMLDDLEAGWDAPPEMPMAEELEPEEEPDLELEDD